MAKRFRDTAKFDRQWYMELRPRLKCAADYILDKCDNAGVWQINVKLLNAAVNDLKKITLEELLKIDDGKQFVEFEPGKIYCADFIQFQYGTLSENCKPHLSIISLLKKYNLFERVSKGYPKGIHTLKDTDKEKEEEKEKETDKEKEGSEKISELVFPFTSQKFLQVWATWIDYRRQIKKPYKNTLSEQAALKQLSEFPEEYAIDLIEKSIANSYQGLVFSNTKSDYLKQKNHEQPTLSESAENLNRKIAIRYGDHKN